MTQYLDLKPYNTVTGEGLYGSFSDIEQTPVPFGGGSLTDDSDASWQELGAQQDFNTGNGIVETVAGDFVMPDPDVPPLAFVVKMRAKNSDDVLASPPPFYRSLRLVVSDTATNTVFHAQDLGNYGGDWVLGPLMDVTADTPAWFAWYWNANPNLSDPTDAGNWATMSTFPEMGDALTTTGLRVAIAWYWQGDGNYVRRAWLDMYELRLYVALPGGVTTLPPLRQHPRSDGLRASSARQRFPRHRSAQASNRRAGGYI